MSTLVAPSDVRQVLEVPVAATDEQLQYFINSADLIITEQLSSLGYSAARLFQLELYMSCHFAQLLTERGGLTGSRTGESSDTYQKFSGVGFMNTRYGQQAVMFDTSGTLLAMSSTSLSAIFGVYGTIFADYATTGTLPNFVDPDSNTTIPGYWG